MRILSGIALAGLLAITLTPAGAEKPPPETWDGLDKVAAKRFDIAYMAPGANFSTYTKVMIDPTEASFRKNWQKKFNNSAIGLQGRITDEEAREMLEAIQEGFQDIFRQAYRDAGYEVVTTPGEDVVRLRTAVVNIDVDAPDQMTSDRRTTYSQEGGQAMLVLEARDSMSGALLARGVDQREVGDSGFAIRRTRVSNRSDFERAFKTWAKMSADALTDLRGAPAPPEG